MKGICVVAFFVTCVPLIANCMKTRSGKCQENWTGLIRHEDCTKFYHCVKGDAREISCPPGLHFNVEALLCDWAEHANCVNGPKDDTAEEVSEEDSEQVSQVSNESGGSAPKPDLKCSDDWTVETLLPHEKCNMFYKCSYGVPVELECQEGLLYNSETWQCDWPENVNCERAPKTDTSEEVSEQVSEEDSEQVSHEESVQVSNESDGSAPKPDLKCSDDWTVETLLPHEKCNMFYKCSYGVPVELECQEGLLYNSETWQCDWPENVNCERAPKTDTSEEVSEQVSEEDSEQVSHEDSVQVSNESDGSAPKPDSKCSDDWTVETLLPHEKCNMFYKCSYGVPVELECQEGLLYNSETWQCDWPENVNCERGPKTDTSEEVSEEDSEQVSHEDSVQVSNESDGSAPKPDSKCSDDWTVETLLPHEKCNMFYKCSYGVPVELVCQEGLLYNSETWQCDWPENVDCSGRR